MSTTDLVARAADVPAIADTLPWSGSASPVMRYLAGLASGSRPTQTSALRAVARMLGYASMHDVPWHRLTLSEAAALSAKLREGRHPSTANRMLTAVRAVLNVCRKERWLVIPVDGEYRMSQTEWYEQLCEELPLKSIRKQFQGVYITPEHVQRMFEACRNKGDARGLRDAAVLALGIGAGLREAEIAALQMAHIQKDRLLVKGGKGDKDRVTALPASFLAVLNDWIRVRGDADGPVIVRMTGRNTFPKKMSGITEHAVWDAIVAIRDEMGFYFTPHDMRRTCATYLLRSGEQVKHVQRMLGHADVRTTMKYHIVEDEEMVRSVNQKDMLSGGK